MRLHHFLMDLPTNKVSRTSQRWCYVYMHTSKNKSVKNGINSIIYGMLQEVSCRQKMLNLTFLLVPFPLYFHNLKDLKYFYSFCL